MVLDGGHIPDTDHSSYKWGNARDHPMQESLRAEGYGRMAGACFIGHFIRFVGIPVHDSCMVEFHTDSESLLKRHETVRDTIGASAYYRLQSYNDVIRAIEDLESYIPLAITYHWVEGHQDKTKEVRKLPWPAQLNLRADELATEAINKQSRTRRVPTLIPLVQFCNNWLPVGQCLIKYGNTYDHCSPCRQHESYDHVFCCQSCSAWRASFLCSLDEEMKKWLTAADIRQDIITGLT
jgi:hypothetical protein